MAFVECCMISSLKLLVNKKKGKDKMERIDVKQLNDNVFETIGKEWLLVCSGDKENFNMMTASWG